MVSFLLDPLVLGTNNTNTSIKYNVLFLIIDLIDH